MAETSCFEPRQGVELGEHVPGTLDGVLRQRQEGVELACGSDPLARLSLVPTTPTVDGPGVMRPPEQERGYRRKEQVATGSQPKLQSFELPERRVGAREPL